VRAVEVRVHGRVQGVWFRGSTRDEARRLGLAGWVSNRDDGTVQARLQGDPAAVEAMVAWCRIGPPGAEVTRLDVEDAEADDTLSEFRIR
jgi:acylphosphatase